MRLSGPRYIGKASDGDHADLCQGVSSGSTGTVGVDDHKSSAAKSPAPPGCVASGADGVGSGKSVAAALPCLAANRRKPIKAVSFAEKPMIVLVMDSPSDEYMFYNKWGDGSPKVSFHLEKSAASGAVRLSRRSWHTLVPRT